MAQRAIFGSVTWVCLACSLTAQALTFPNLSGRVVDEAGILSEADRASLATSLERLEEKTTDQLVVVTLKSLQGTSIENFGYQLGRHWQIGQKDKNNGVLLIVAPSERNVRIEVGYGLEGTLTDALSKVIIESTILPRFRDGDFAGGIKRGVEDIVEALTGVAGEWQQPARDSGPLKGYTVREYDEHTAEKYALPLIMFAFVISIFVTFYCLLTAGGICLGIIAFVTLRGSKFLRFAFKFAGTAAFKGGGGSFGGGGSSGRW